MIYQGTVKSENILFLDENGLCASIELIKSCDMPTFTVMSDIHYDDWVWEFWMDDPAAYEVIKHAIMSVLADSNNFKEAIKELDKMFSTDFAELVVDEDEFGDCDGDCANCEIIE